MRVERAGGLMRNRAATKLPVSRSFCSPRTRTRVAANASNSASADRTVRSWAVKMRSSEPRNAASETDFGGEIVKS